MLDAAHLQNNLLARHLYGVWSSDRAKTLTWWSGRWGVPLPMVEHWVRGTRRIPQEHAVVFSDLPFSRQEYYAAAIDLLLSTPPELPPDFVGGNGRASQKFLGTAFLPIQKSVDASVAFGLLQPRVTAPTGDNPDLAGEVASAVRELGRMTKDQIVATFGLTADQYRDIHSRLVAERQFESGPRGVGGLVAKLSRSRNEEAAGPSTVRLDGWAREGAERLETLLSQSILLDLIGDLESGIRNARRIETGEDRPSRKSELAAALILKHGIDLFSDPDIRTAVAKATRTKAPERWHPGKATAAKFVDAVAFPAEFAGLLTPDSLPDMEYLEGRFHLDPLQQFQKEVQKGLLETLQDPPGRRCIVTLPTGGGKTRVAVDSIKYWMFDRYDHAVERAKRGTVVWLAHTEELCEQACACFRQVWQASDDVAPVTLVRFWGSYMKDLVEKCEAIEDAVLRPSVVVSTPQRVASLFEGNARGSDEVLAAIRDNLGLIVVDEAHRAAAPMYRKVISALAGVASPQVSIVGLTATPFRLEYDGRDPEKGTRDLKDIFDRIVEPIQTLGPNPRLRLQEMGVLAAPQFASIETGTRFRIPNVPEDEVLSEEEMERIDRVLAVRADTAPRRTQVMKQIVQIAADPAASILYFGPSVRDAECMAYLLRERGLTAAVVSGTTRDVTRRRVIEEFKSGAIRVLCNCEVLTTGFDAPKVSHVVIARPTVSRVLYEQIVGRGLRGPKFNGTETCAIIDCQDDIRGPRPTLGYESFRAIWYAEGSAADDGIRS